MMTPHELPEQEPVVGGGEANDPQRRDVAGRPRHRRVDVTPDRYGHRRARADRPADALDGQCHHTRRLQALQELAAFARFQAPRRTCPAKQLTDRRRQLLATEPRVLPHDRLDQIEFFGTDRMTDEIPGVLAHDCLLGTLTLLNSRPFVQSSVRTNRERSLPNLATPSAFVETATKWRPIAPSPMAVTVPCPACLPFA